MCWMHMAKLSIPLQSIYSYQFINMNSQESRPTWKATENEQIPNKRLKRAAFEECSAESVRKNKIKLDADSQRNKITNYINKPTISNHPNPTNQNTPSADNNNKVEQLEERIKEKDRLIAQLKERRQAEEQKANQIIFQTREFKRKSKNIIATSMLKLAEIQRAQKLKKDDRLGYFSQNMRTFVEGGSISSLRQAIVRKETELKKLQLGKKSKLLSSEQASRNISSYQFINRELADLKKELLHRQKEVVIYKDRIKLAMKEIHCKYHLEGWPVVYDRYQTLELLGAGGFGEVYKCYDLENNRIVALKVVVYKTKSGRIDPLEKEDFFKKVQRQADIQRQLEHPNIAKFISLVEMNIEANRMVFQLEYCSGPELSVYLRKHQCLEQKEAKSIIKQLFSAISYLSRLKQKVIHYDLKPSNIMFCDGVIKMLDFGLCKVMLESEETRIELTSQGVGTYWYLPPETFDQYDPKITPKVDVWSLGIVFFEMLYGRKPFGNGIPQDKIYQNGTILKAFKPQFPKQTPKRYKVSQSAIEFISLCLKYNESERLSPIEAYEHAYLKK